MYIFNLLKKVVDQPLRQLGLGEDKLILKTSDKYILLNRSDPRPELLVRLAIYGDKLVDIDECTNFISIQPSSVGIKGHPWPHNPHVIIPHSFWEIEVVSKCYSSDEAISKLIDKIWDQRDRIKNYVKTTSVEYSFTCVVRIYEDDPLYDISADNLKKLAFFDCEFGFDIYDKRT